MRAFKVLLPVVLGIVITFGVLLSAASAGEESGSPASSNGNIIYVNANNYSGTYNGESWLTAYQDLQDALADAESGDQIWVGHVRAGTMTSSPTRS